MQVEYDNFIAQRIKLNYFVIFLQARILRISIVTSRCVASGLHGAVGAGGFVFFRFCCQIHQDVGNFTPVQLKRSSTYSE